MSVISQTEPQIKDTQSQISQVQSALANSPTAASTTAPPTSADLSNAARETSLETNLQKLQKQYLSAAWYGDQTNTTSDQGGATSGVIGTVLNKLQAPLHGVVAGVRSLMGDTTPSTQPQDFSDLLKSHNVPYAIAAPLGFTLDVALDPVNWLTAGTGALVPRLAVGAWKGAAEAGAEGALRGLSAGATSSALEKAATVAKWTPGLSRTSFAEGLSQKAGDAWETYKNATGINPLEHIASPGILRGKNFGLTSPAGEAQAGLNLSALARGIMSYVPKGNDIYNSLYYSSRDWVENQRLLDAAERYSAKSSEAAAAGFKPVDEALSSAAATHGVSSPIVKPNVEILKNVPAGAEKAALIDELNKASEDVSFISANPQNMASANPEEAAWRVVQEAQGADELRNVMSQLRGIDEASGSTGIKAYDNATNWAKNVKITLNGKDYQPIRGFLDAYQSLIQGAFKPAHTILSPTTWAMNILSAPVMYMMMGGEDVTSFMKLYGQSYRMLMGFDPRTYFAHAFTSPEWQQLFDESPGLFRKSAGFGPGFVRGKYVIDKMVQMGRDQGLITAQNEDQVLAEMSKFAKEMDAQTRTGNLKAVPNEGPLAAIYRKVVKKPAPTAYSTMLEKMRQGGIQAPTSADLPANFTVRDPLANAEVLDRIEQWVANKASEGSVPAKLASNFFQTARAGYEHQDQAGRLAIMRQLTETGMSENGLKILSRFSPLNPEKDLIARHVVNGKVYWTLSPVKAVDIANDVMINYAAMPAAIRMLRNLPLVGAPFASFGYGMALRTAQTMAYNPAVFNRVAFAIRSASGKQTPLEKAALHPPAGQPNYYGFLNSPTELRLPMNFFDKYPLYYNLTNVLPYYTLNIFQPSSRTYSQVLPNDIVSTLDSLPIMKDPIGSTLFDFFVLPTMIGNARPQSYLGQPLYPVNATSAQKGFYLGRNLADQFTPSGIAPVGSLLPSDYAQYLPGFRTREFATGKAGENQLGIPGSEPAASRQIRNLLGYLGFPVERVDTTFVMKQNRGGP